MKKLLQYPLCLLVLIVLLVSCATTKETYIPIDNEELYGTWVNQDYGATEFPFPEKIIMNPDGTMEWYSSMNDLVPNTGECTIIDKWIDSEGNVFYKALSRLGDDTYGKQKAYELHKISNLGQIWEHVYFQDKFPTEKDLNQDHFKYFIYYRQ